MSLRIFVCAALMLGSPAADSQTGAVSDARSGIKALGKEWNGRINAATQALYLKLQREADQSGVRVIQDVSYGDHRLQGFDLFVPEPTAESAFPVLVYLHGGGLVRGDKVGAGTDGLIYGNVGRFAARNGIIGVNANYRLVPDVEWPGGAEDVRSIIEWLVQNVADYGGDPGTIFLMGNSAGATHVATYLFSTESQFGDGPRVAGALLSSGAYAAGNSDAEIAYYGADEAQRIERSPLGLVDAYEGPTVPIFLWSAELDPAFIETPVAGMYEKLCAKYDDCPRFTQFAGHNHVSHVMSLNSADGEVGDAVLEFLRSVTRDR